MQTRLCFYIEKFSLNLRFEDFEESFFKNIVYSKQIQVSSGANLLILELNSIHVYKASYISFFDFDGKFVRI